MVSPQQPIAIASPPIREISLENVDEVVQFIAQQQHEDYVGELPPFSPILEQLQSINCARN